MKKFKKFAALLLAGVLMLTMLTACSSGPKSLGAQMADVYLEYINKCRSPEKAKLTNDATLQALAKQALDTIDPETDLIDEEALERFEDEKVPKGVLVAILTDTGAKATVVTQENLEETKKMVESVGDEMVGYGDVYEAIGFAWRTVNGKTYFGMAARGMGE